MSMTDAAPSLSEAVTKFVAEKKNSKKDMGNRQELGKFVAWCGRDRAVEQLSPSEVADYAHHIGLGGGRLGAEAGAGQAVSHLPETRRLDRDQSRLPPAGPPGAAPGRRGLERR